MLLLYLKLLLLQESKPILIYQSLSKHYENIYRLVFDLLKSVFVSGKSGSGLRVHGESRVNHQIPGEENKDAAEQSDD